MRPGPIGPGINKPEPDIDERFEASMRPGPIGPGIKHPSAYSTVFQ